MLSKYTRSVQGFIKISIHLYVFFLSTVNLSASFKLIELEKDEKSDKVEHIKKIREVAIRMVLLSNDSCMIIYKQALELADKYNDKEEKSLLLRDIGQLYIMNGSFNVAIDTLNKTWGIAGKNNFTKLIWEIKSNIGVAYNYKGEYEIAIDYYSKLWITAYVKYRFHDNNKILLESTLQRGNIEGKVLDWH